MTEYRMLRASDIPEAVEISKRQLGVDYLDDGDFEDAMSDPGQFCVVAEEGGRVAGFSICQVFGPELEGEKLMLPDCPERDLVMSIPLTGLLDSVAVSADFKGKGIGTELGRRCNEEMRARGVEIIYPDKRPFEEAAAPMIERYKADPVFHDLIEQIQHTRGGG